VDDERIFIAAEINGHPVHLALDTGMGTQFLLTSAAAQKLNLKVTQPSSAALIGPAHFRVGLTGPQKLDLGSIKIETRFAVADLPGYLTHGLDGLIGWPALTNNVFSLDCVAHTLSLFTNSVADLAGWLKLRIQSVSGVLGLELPGGENPREILVLDSGATQGVQLAPQKWREWKAAHTNQPLTLEGYYTPGAGIVVAEEGWAGKISLGPLTLTEVPVMPADSADVALCSSPATRLDAALGLAAMKRLDIVIDGRQSVVYLQPKTAPPMPYEYNHLGAVFVPKDLQGDNLFAHVVEGSPASQAGIRNDDILLKIGDLDCTSWRTNPDVLASMKLCLDSPAGTKLELTLKRGDDTIRASAILRNILPPDPAASSN
jgi:Aspartyl protease